MKKIHSINKKTILKKNIKIDRAQLNDVLKILGELRIKGLKTTGYNINSPYAKRCVDIS